MTTRQTASRKGSSAEIRVRFPPKRILVPMDLTEQSLEVWKQAQAVAGWFGASVDAVHVQPWMNVTYAMAAAGGVPAPYLSQECLRECLERLRDELGPGVTVNSYAGDIEDGIVSWARDGYDLLVMATHGRTGLERAVRGSIAEHVVRHSPIPVLVTRGKTQAVRTVLAPISFEPESRAGLLAAAHAAERLKARLQVLHVVSGGLAGHASVRGLKKLMQDWVARLPERIRRSCDPKIELAFGSAPAQICEAAGRADLVVLTAHRQGLLSETVLGTVAERVLRHCPAPVLTIPALESEDEGA